MDSEWFHTTLEEDECFELWRLSFHISDVFCAGNFRLAAILGLDPKTTEINLETCIVFTGL